MTTIGLVAPGAMGTEVGSCAMVGGAGVVWASESRSAQTRQRATRAGFDDVGRLPELCQASDVLLSICPPHAALQVAREAAANDFQGIYVDANAIAPGTARQIRDLVEPRAMFVDGGLIGPPPTRPGTTRLYLAGERAAMVAALFAAGPLEAVVLAQPAPAASALKIAYAGWTKGSSALLLAVRYARSHRPRGSTTNS